MTIGDIRPQGGSTIEVEVPQVAVAPISADTPDAEQQQTPATTPARGSTMPDCDSVMPTQSAVADLTPTRGQNLQPIFEQKEDEDPEKEQEAIDHPRLRQMIQRGHLVDNILGSLQKGITTRSHLANFCQLFLFVSSLEPLKVEQALGDPDWVMAMQEELNNFKRNQVWTLVE